MRWQSFAALFFVANVLTGGTLHLKTRNVETDPLVADYQTGSARQWNAARAHFLLQYGAPVSSADRDDLAARGATIVQSVPDNALLITAPVDFSADGLNTQYATRLRAEDKVSPALPSGTDTITAVVEFFPDVDHDDAQQLLSQGSLQLIAHPDLAPNHFQVTGAAQDVLDLQSWDEVAYIFPASDDLQQGSRVQGCAGALTSDGSLGQYVIVGHGWTAGASGSVNLNYAFSTLTNKLTDASVKNEIIRALAQWSKVTRVQFTASTNSQAARTIAISFLSKDHGDGFPFDGPGGVLAHTFYPSNAEPIAGDMHMDADENWHIGVDTDVYTVALHEIGHALGLGHSDQPGAVMYPYYRFGAQLSADDIRGVQSLYGAPSSAQTTATPAGSPITITVVTPGTGARQTTAATVAVSGTEANGTGATGITWQTDHGASGQATGTSAWSIGAVPLVNGTNTITVTATDSKHQVARTTLVVTRSATASTGKDTTAPVLNLVSPSLTILQTNQSALSMTGTASDNVGVTRVSWQNGSATGNATGTNTWTASVPLINGSNTVIVRAFDAAGNSSWRSVTVSKR